MTAILLKAAAFVLVILLGYGLKRAGLFGPGAADTVTKIMLNITLPAAIITGFCGFEKSGTLFALVVLGFLCNVGMYLVGYLMTLRGSRPKKALYTLNLPGYNIGAFTLPFIQNFMGPSGVVATCMFDTGNAIMCTGGAYAVTACLVGNRDGSPVTVRSFFKRLLSSTPFDTYMVMLALAGLGVRIPEAVDTLLSPIAASNGFMAMLVIGMMFEFRAKPAYLKSAALILVIRYAAAAGLSWLAYFYLPLPLLMRQVLVILLFSPVTVLSPVFTEKCGGDAGLSSFTGSVSILISIVIMVTLVAVMHIG
ncbi:AEC family transporter [Eubacterium sp. 1001713B170207_170306_E7]|uniref:AEC family transporter n=1 Tax=Eubacterium sp. 1001713B170207_170306_E7 TaxID=2787097 RepID=UPI0018986CD7|nr:AEC family transporter [Eubacterium sp. 1001713B170207_170306_E7]